MTTIDVQFSVLDEIEKDRASSGQTMSYAVLSSPSSDRVESERSERHRVSSGGS